MLHQSLHRAIVLLLLAGLFFLPGCRPAQPAKPSGEPTREKVAGVRGGSLTVRFTSPPKTFNYLMVTDEIGLAVAYNLLCSRLIDFDHDEQKYVGGLAESWKIESDGRTVTMLLRDGLKFSDGHPLTSDDVAFTFAALYDPKTGSPIFHDAMMLEGKPIEVTVVAARNLKLTFPVVVATPESYLYNLAVLPKHVLQPDQQQGKLAEAWSVSSDPAHIITSGPFTVESVVPGERVTLKRNPYYWKKDPAGTALPYLDTLVLDVIPDANQTFTRLGQGSLDIADRIRSSDYAALKQNPGAVRPFDQGPGLTTDYLWFNQNSGTKDGKPIVAPAKLAWFTDVRFRRAVSLAIDRDTIASATLQGLATPLSGIVSPGNHAWVAADLPKLDYSLDSSRGLLKEAGYAERPGADGPELFDAKGNRVEFTVIVPAENKDRMQMATAVQSALGKLGMKIQVAPVEGQGVTQRWTETFDYEAILFGVSLTDTEPISYAGFLRSDSSAHLWYPKEPKPMTPWEARLDELVATISRETDPAKRQAAFHEAQAIMAEQLPVIPLVARHVISAASARVGNYRPSNILPLSLWNADELFVKK